MSRSINDTTTLSNGVEMPWLGLGTWRATPGKETQRAVAWALSRGYRSIDTAHAYQNEKNVGDAVRKSRIPREEVFVTTKLWNSDHRYDDALRAFGESLKRLGMDYVDLYLIHWPVKGTFREAWRALEAIYGDGRARAIGVSNFHVHHLEDLMDGAKVTPTVNQVEFHPRLQQPELQAFCREENIQFEAWAPLLKGRVLEIPEIVKIGEKHGKSAVHVTLRWQLQKGIVTIPKSVHKDRIDSNADLFDFRLDKDDMAAMDALDRNERVGPDPDNVDF